MSSLFGHDLTTPDPDPHDERTRRWLLRIAAGHDPDRPASTPGCPHGRRWCDGCEEAAEQAAARAEQQRLDTEAGL